MVGADIGTTTMTRAILPVTDTDVQNETYAPLAPYLILEIEDGVVLYTPGWPIAIPRCALEDVTEEDVRAAMRLPDTVTVRLSAARYLPTDDLNAKSLWQWAREWRQELLANLRQQPAVAKAS
jgi:hypothetical protein